MNPQLVHTIARLAAIPITQKEEEKLSQGFIKTLQVVDQLMSIDTSGVDPTHQVTGLENITREDAIDTARMLTQDEALSNAKRSFEGYFVVGQLISE